MSRVFLKKQKTLDTYFMFKPDVSKSILNFLRSRFNKLIKLVSHKSWKNLKENIQTQIPGDELL